MEFERFGVMIDCSRNAVMKPEQVKRLIDVLVKFGYNALELYTEDTYEVEGEPYFGHMRGRYTGKEIQDIDEYAKSKGVELIPCIQTLAHFTATSKCFALRDLFDVNDILLCEEEKTYEFIDKCFASIAKNFSSRQVNIGMDEAWMLGLGNYLKKHGYVKRFDILTKHLSRVLQIAEKYGFKPHMWSDMFFRYFNEGYYGKNFEIPREVLEKVPQNVALTYWDYTTQDKEQSEDMFKAHFEMTDKVWYAGAAWSYSGFVPLNGHSLLSMKIAMESVRKFGVKNVLITMWGNDGKECSFFALLPALYAIRQYADGNFDEEKIKRGFEEIVGIPYDDYMSVDLPNETVWTGLEDWGGHETPSKWMLYQDCFQGFFDADLKGREEIPFDKYANKLFSVAKKAGEYDYVFKTIGALSKVLEIKGFLGLRTREAYRSGDKEKLMAVVEEYKETIRRLRKFYKCFAYLWEKENKPFGWEIHDIRLGGLERRLKTCAERLQAYAEGKLDCIAELEIEPLPSHRPDLNEATYTNFVSYNVF